MVKQRFLTLFRRWFFTVIKVIGPILLYQLFLSVRDHLRFVPLGTLDVLLGALAILLFVALVCGLWAWGEWAWAKLRRLRGFGSELRRCCRDYWSPQTVTTRKA